MISRLTQPVRFPDAGSLPMGHTTSLEDAALLMLVEQRDEQAITTLFDRHAGLVFSVALRILRDSAAAEDILQEVFLLVWRNPLSFNVNRGNMRGWLAVIARNRAIDIIRGRRPSASIEDVVLTSPCDIAGDCEQRLMVERAHVLIHQLPLPQQKMLEMAFYQGLTHAEIAKQTGLPLGTVKTKIRRALLALRTAAQA